MPYEVDAWSGDLHQVHVGSKKFDDWRAASDFMERLVDAGLLCNALHTDFKAPLERIREMQDELAKTLR